MVYCIEETEKGDRFSMPSLAPEWLRSTGGGNHFASSQPTDGSSSSLSKRNRVSKTISNLKTPYSSFLDQSSSTKSRRSLSSNGCVELDKNSDPRSYSYYTRNQPSKDREKLGILDTFDHKDSDSLKSIIPGRIEKDALRCTQSMMSRRPDELSQRRVFTDLRNSSHSINCNGNGAIIVEIHNTGIQKGSAERDFQLIGSHERPPSLDMVRVPSPGISKGVQGLSIGTSLLVGSEGWSSAVAEGVGSNSSLSLPAPWPSIAAGAAVAGPFPASSDGALNGLDMADALTNVHASDNGPQQSVKTQRSKESPFMASKQLIPVTSSIPKSLVHNPSDKLKPKTASRPSDAGGTRKNCFQHMPSSQLGGNQSTRSFSARVDGSNSSSTGKMMLLKPARENGVSATLKDAPCRTSIVTSMVENGSSTAASSVASVPLKNPDRVKLSTTAHRTSAYCFNAGSVVGKQLSLAQLQSRNDFFNRVRMKSMGGTSSTGLSVVVPAVRHNSDELKELASGSGTMIAKGSDVKCNGDTCSLAESFSDSKVSDLSEDAGINSNEEEKAFLRSLGWEENTGDDEGLTEEEITGFYQKHMEWIPASKLFRGLQLKTTQSNQSTCSAAAS